MASAIQISNGVSTYLLNDGVSFRLKHGTWSPAIPPRRQSTLGGRSIYDDVEESITLDILGATAADALANLAALSTTLDQADRWYLEENVSPVTLTYKPDGANSISGLQTLILGRVGDEPLFGLSSLFNDVTYLYEIRDVVLKFKRRSLWVDATTQAAASAASTAGEILTATFAAGVLIPSPTKVLFTGASLALSNGALLLLASAASKFSIINAFNMAGTAGFTSVNDAANRARGTNVLRYTPVDTLEKPAQVFSSVFNPRKMAIYATIRNNSVTTTWAVSLSGTYSYASNTPVKTAAIQVDASTVNPRVFFLGFIATRPTSLVSYNINVQASAASGTLDIDEIVLVDVDDETSKAIGILSVSLGNPEIGIDPAILTQQKPIVGSPSGGVGTAIDRYAQYQGDTFITIPSTVVAGMILAPTGTNWRAYNGGLITFTLNATRYPAYIAPY
jgi:hypothetical protein